MLALFALELREAGSMVECATSLANDCIFQIEDEHPRSIMAQLTLLRLLHADLSKQDKSHSLSKFFFLTPIALLPPSASRPSS